MAIDIRKFVKGLGITPTTTSPITEKGELRVNDSDGKLRYHNGTTESAVVTESHAATLTNKTIDGDDNTLQDISLSSLKVDAGNANKVLKRDGSGAVISGNPIPASSHPVVTTEDTQTLKNKTIDTDDNPNVSVALNKLKTGPNNVILRRDGSGIAVDGNSIPNSSAVVTIDAAQTLTNKIIENAQLAKITYNEIEVNSTLTGSNAELNPNSSVVLLTNSGLVSINRIHEKELSSPLSGAKLILVNLTGNTITLVHDSGSPSSRRIITGIDSDLDVENTGSVHLIYDGQNDRWRIVGGSGTGAILSKAVAGENLSLAQPVYISKGSVNGDAGRTAGQAYVVDPNNEHRMEFVGLASKAVTAGSTATIVSSGQFTIPVALIQGGAFIQGELVYWNGTQYTTTVPSNTDFWLLKVGKAVTTTRMLINPDLAASAVYVPATVNTATIANNITSPTTLPITFNPANDLAFEVHYNVRRIAGSTELVETGILSGHYDSIAGQWILVNHSIIGDAAVTFSMSGSSIAYTSSNMSGSPYTGTIQFNIRSTIKNTTLDTASIANNVTTMTNLGSLVFGPTLRGVVLFYMARRNTTSPSVERSESGYITLVRNSTAGTWSIGSWGISGDAEISFGITSGGQIQYTSSNMTGSGYSGNIYWEVLQIL